MCKKFFFFLPFVVFRDDPNIEGWRFLVFIFSLLLSLSLALILASSI